VFKRFEGVAGIVGEEHARARAQGGQQVDLVVLKRERLRAASELHAPFLSRQHDEHGLHVRARASEQVVVEDIPAIDDG
jgi:hypothetical protein